MLLTGQDIYQFFGLERIGEAVVQRSKGVDVEVLL